MVPELAKQTRSDMMNSVVAPIAQVKQEPQVGKTFLLLLYFLYARAGESDVVSFSFPPFNQAPQTEDLTRVMSGCPGQKFKVGH